MVIDNGFRHEAKIKTKHLDCLPLSGFNHIAVYIKWAYSKGLLSDKLLKAEPRLEAAISEGTDIRDIIANSEYKKGNYSRKIFTGLKAMAVIRAALTVLPYIISGKSITTLNSGTKHICLFPTMRAIAKIFPNT